MENPGEHINVRSGWDVVEKVALLDRDPSVRHVHFAGCPQDITKFVKQTSGLRMARENRVKQGAISATDIHHRPRLGKVVRRGDSSETIIGRPGHDRIKETGMPGIRLEVLKPGRVPNGLERNLTIAHREIECIPGNPVAMGGKKSCVMMQ